MTVPAVTPTLLTHHSFTQLVLELMPRGGLDGMLWDKSVRLTWESPLLRMALDAAHAMVHLHSMRPQPVIHRDLKSMNLLIDDVMTAKLADFGESRTLNRESDETMTASGSPLWSAPVRALSCARLFALSY